MTIPLVTIIYLTHNRLEMTKTTLPRLLESSPDVDFKVQIHDNGSSDGTPEFLKSLDHPRISTIEFSPTNLGIAPVTNKFWKTCQSQYLGKIDNDISVPEDWAHLIMERQLNAQEDNVGPITLYHWINEWVSDLRELNMTILTTSSGAKIARSSHTGGNYIMHRYLVDKYGPVNESQGLKGGFTCWQNALPKEIIKGYVYPIKCFRQEWFEKSWTAYKEGKQTAHNKQCLEHERREAKRLLELPQSVYTR
jgi:glycosyltransferase involved in cell wall biosynthesis